MSYLFRSVELTRGKNGTRLTKLETFFVLFLTPTEYVRIKEPRELGDVKSVNFGKTRILKSFESKYKKKKVVESHYKNATSLRKLPTKRKKEPVTLEL